MGEETLKKNYPEIAIHLKAVFPDKNRDPEKRTEQSVLTMGPPAPQSSSIYHQTTVRRHQGEAELSAGQGQCGVELHSHRLV